MDNFLFLLILNKEIFFIVSNNIDIMFICYLQTPFGGINCHSVKRLFSEGHLHPTALLLCPHSAIQNLPQPRQLRPSLVGPSAMMVGQVVQGVRLAEARGRPLGSSPSSNITSGSPDNEVSYSNC